MKKIKILNIATIIFIGLILTQAFRINTFIKDEKSHENKVEKQTPMKIIEFMKQGNERFKSGKSNHPNSDFQRITLANEKNQGDYAYATVLTCSDSRVPVEMIFDAGIMDLFIVKVAGNVADVDEIGTIEYGVCHVNTPLVVVMGHTKCGAVTAVTHAVEGHGHALEFNIPALVDNITPAVLKAKKSLVESSEDEIISLAIEENVWQSISDILLRSGAVREKVKSGNVKIVGAIYNLENGNVKWLDDKVNLILQEVEKSPNLNTKILAE